MVDIPWSGKPKINDLVLSDILMRRTPSRSIKNQEIPFSDVIPFIYDNIGLLTDGKSTILSSAQIAFVQGGSAFRGSIRPNPVRQINVINQAQLEAELGTNIEIPLGTAVTVVIDETFTLTKPFKIGVGSFLEIYGSTVETVLTYTGTGALFQNFDPDFPITALLAHNLVVAGNGSNSVFDIFGSSSLDVDKFTMETFGSMGTAKMSFVLFDSCSAINVNRGLVIREAFSVVIEKFLPNTAGGNATYFTIISKINPVNVDINAIRFLFSTGNETLVFFDPNSFVGSAYTIEKSDSLASDVYQVGIDITINSVADNGSGEAEFTTAAVHNLQIGKAVVISGYITNTDYNGTFIVTAIPSTTIFEVAEIAFGTDEAGGNMNKSSLDNTSPLVVAQDNTNSEDSMNTGKSGIETFGAVITSSSLATNAFEVITSALWASQNLERFSEGVVNTGQLICNDLKTRRYIISYSASLEKNGGGSLNLGIVILKNGANVSFNPPHTVNSGIVQISGSEIIELATGDTLDIAVINFDGTATAIDISQASLVVNRA